MSKTWRLPMLGAYVMPNALTTEDPRPVGLVRGWVPAYV
jgi:hypothetical protein